jgi:hypothetical protein
VTVADRSGVAAPLAASRSPLDLAVGFLSSMKLAVWLVLILGLLTWLGTLAQMERSTFDVQKEYFESWFVLARLPLSIWGEQMEFRGEPAALVIPLPGAYPVMGLLFLNLMIGGLVRMRWQARNAGVLITHVGIAMLLVAGFVKMHYSYSGSLALYEAPEQVNPVPGRVYQSGRFVSFHDYELALLVDRGDTVEERVVAEAFLHPARDRTVVLRPEGLPFVIEVSHWTDHARVVPAGPNVRSPVAAVDGVVLLPQEWPKGVQPKSENEIAGCHVTVRPDGGKPLQSILWGFPRLPFDEARYPFAFEVQGQRYGLDLRHVVFDLPFAMRLKKFQKLDHPGTMSPRDFRSYVTVSAAGANQEAEIFMNNPLRRDGYVVYQTSWGPQSMGGAPGGPPWYSVFEVSFNPSDSWPMLACFVIAFGLLIHFVAKLRRFLQSSTRTSLQS